jgi:hypothetical protein
MEEGHSSAPTTPSQAECLTFVKFARYTALTADRLAGALVSLTERLEDVGVIDPNRTSRLLRDQKLRSHTAKVAKSDQAVTDLLKLLPHHPDGEQLIQSLFQDLDVPSVILKGDRAASVASSRAESAMDTSGDDENGPGDPAKPPK